MKDRSTSESEEKERKPPLSLQSSIKVPESYLWGFVDLALVQRCYILFRTLKEAPRY